MINYHYLVLAGALLGSVASPIFATPTTVGFSCEFDNGSRATGCSLTAVPLAGAQEYEVSFVVDYTFHCLGNRIDVGLTTEAGFKPFERGDQKQRLTIDGKSFLQVTAAYPQQLYAASLSKDCYIEVLKLTALPSDATLQGWQNAAALASNAVHDALDTWLLARDLDHIVDFDNSQFAHLSSSVKDTISGLLAEGGLTWEQMINPATGRFWNANAEPTSLPQGWPELVTMHPDLVDLIVLYDYSIDALQGRPPTHNKPDVESAAHNLRSTQSLRYLSKLKTKMRAGQDLIDRATRYLELLSGDLQVLRADLQSARQAYPALN